MKDNKTFLVSMTPELFELLRQKAFDKKVTITSIIVEGIKKQLNIKL